MFSKRSIAAGICWVIAVASSPVHSQSLWKEPQDAAEALNNPDKYAWRLFVALNWPAISSRKEADSSKPFGEPTPAPVVWETWRNARNSPPNNPPPDTAFPPDGSDPGAWLSGTVDPTNIAARFERGPVQQRIRREQMERSGVVSPLFDDAAAAFAINETRLNKATYEFIRGSSEYNLYSLEGQIAFFNQNAKTIAFPLMSKEVKAQWREIDDTSAAKARYHWTLGNDGKVYGLTALHITTKDLPNWFWATFEHIDNKRRASDGGRPGNEGWLLPSKDTFACKSWDLPSNCEKAPKTFDEILFAGTKWEHYVLRGTQIDFIDSRGVPTLLANSQPEQGFQLTSSCITCHARATVGANGSRLPIFKPDGHGHVGSPRQEWFEAANGRIVFTQLDFVWALMRACPKTPPRPRFCKQ